MENGYNLRAVHSINILKIQILHPKITFGIFFEWFFGDILETIDSIFNAKNQNPC